MYYISTIVLALAALILAAQAAPTADNAKVPEIKVHAITREQYDRILELAKKKDDVSAGRLISGFGSFSEGITTITKPISSGWSSLLRITGFNSDTANADNDKLAIEGVPLCAVKTDNLLDEATQLKYRDQISRQLSSARYPSVVYRDQYGRPTYHIPREDDDEDTDAANRPIINCVMVVKRKLTDDDDDTVRPPVRPRPRPPYDDYPKPLPLPYPHPIPIPHPHPHHRPRPYPHPYPHVGHYPHHHYAPDHDYDYGHHHHHHSHPAPPRPAPPPPPPPPIIPTLLPAPEDTSNTPLSVDIVSIPEIPGYYIEIQPPAAGPEAAPAPASETEPVAAPTLEAVPVPDPAPAPALATPSEAAAVPVSEPAAAAAVDQPATPAISLPVPPTEDVVEASSAQVAPTDEETALSEVTDPLSEGDGDVAAEIPADVANRIGGNVRPSVEPIAYPLLPQTAIFNAIPSGPSGAPNGLYYYPVNPYAGYGPQPPLGYRRPPHTKRRKQSSKRRPKPNKPAMPKGTPVEVARQVEKSPKSQARQNYDYDQQLAAYYAQQQPGAGPYGYNPYGSLNPASQPYGYGSPYGGYGGSPYGYENTAAGGYGYPDYPGYGYASSNSAYSSDSDEDYDDGSYESGQSYGGQSYSGEESSGEYTSGEYTSGEAFSAPAGEPYGSQENSEEYH